MIETYYFRTIYVLLAVFLVLFTLDLVGVPGVAQFIWWPLALAFAMAAAAALFDTFVLPWLYAHKARLKAFCVGASFKPFHWSHGSESHLRRPGGGLYAFGPIRLAWRFTPTAQSLEAIAPRLIARGETVYIKDGRIL